MWNVITLTLQEPQKEKREAKRGGKLFWRITAENFPEERNRHPCPGSTESPKTRCSTARNITIKRFLNKDRES